MMKSKGTSRKKIVIYGTFLSILCLIIIFSAIVTMYLRKFDRTLTAENKAKLSETAVQIAAHTRSIIEETITSLKVASDGITMLSERADIGTYLSLMAEDLDFAYMGYAATDGVLHTTGNAGTENISSEDYFLSALNGETSATGLKRKIMYDKAVSGILLSTPVYDDANDVTGVLVAMLSKKSLQSALDISSYAGNGYSYVIDGSGELVLYTNSMDYNNFFMFLQNVSFEGNLSLDAILEDIRKGHEGMVLYDNLGTEQYAYYLPLGYNDWTIINIVAKDVVTSNTSSLTKELAYLSIAAVAVFIILLSIAAAAFISSENQRRTADMKSMFLANMSHELRTPMNTVMGVSELLMREKLTGRQQNYVHMIASSSKSLLVIINDILDFSKIESGKLNIAEAPYSVRTLIEDVTALAVNRLADKDVCVYAEISEDLPAYLNGDVDRIKQILVNLLGNAVKFTHQGCISLALSCKRQDDRIQLQMQVADTGTGIRKQDIPKLFTSFNQLDMQSGRKTEGTGLGLAISKQLARLMGGDITVESTYGTGSVFTAAVLQNEYGEEKLCSSVGFQNARLAVLEPCGRLRDYFERVIQNAGAYCRIYHDFGQLKSELSSGNFQYVIAPQDVLEKIDVSSIPGAVPVVLLHQNEYSLYSETAALPHIYAPLFGLGLDSITRLPEEVFSSVEAFDISRIHTYPDSKVLLVDDNQMNLDIAEALLSAYQLKIDKVHSGLEAVQAVKDNDYDIVFMDHMMPEMDGVEALARIRALPGSGYSDLPVIILTANATADAQLMFRSKGFNGFIPKPIDVKLLDTIINKYLRPA